MLRSDDCKWSGYQVKVRRPIHKSGQSLATKSELKDKQYASDLRLGGELKGYIAGTTVT